MAHRSAICRTHSLQCMSAAGQTNLGNGLCGGARNSRLLTFAIKYRKLSETHTIQLTQDTPRSAGSAPAQSDCRVPALTPETAGSALHVPS